MSNEIVVYKGRTNKLSVSLGVTLVGDTITSQIRALPDSTSTLIATWGVTLTNGTGSDGELTLTLDDTVTSAITANSGYMDIKRVTAGEPVAVFERPLEVVFRGSVTP